MRRQSEAAMALWLFLVWSQAKPLIHGASAGLDNYRLAEDAHFKDPGGPLSA